MTMQPFLMEQDRDAQPRLRRRPMLQGIDQRHGLRRVRPWPRGLTEPLASEGRVNWPSPLG
jgi:hypothetical protein